MTRRYRSRGATLSPNGQLAAGLIAALALTLAVISIIGTALS